MTEIEFSCPVGQCTAVKQHSRLRKLWLWLKMGGWYAPRCFHYEGHAKMASSASDWQYSHENYMGEVWTDDTAPTQPSNLGERPGNHEAQSSGRQSPC